VLDDLLVVTGGLTAEDVQNLTTISLESLDSLNFLHLENCPNLTDLRLGLDGDLVIPVYIYITDTGLTNLNALRLSANLPTGTIKLGISSSVAANFTLYAPSVISIEIYNVVDLAGYTTVQPVHSSSIDFPNLLSVNQDVYISGSQALTIVDMPQLTYVLGTFEIADLASLKTLQLPELVKIGGYLSIYNNSALDFVSMPKLQLVEFEGAGYFDQGEALFISNNSLWTRISFPQLISIGATAEANISISGRITGYVYN
jgi:hypothetical protein